MGMQRVYLNPYSRPASKYGEYWGQSKKLLRFCLSLYMIIRLDHGVHSVTQIPSLARSTWMIRVQSRRKSCPGRYSPCRLFVQRLYTSKLSLGSTCFCLTRFRQAQRRLLRTNAVIHLMPSNTGWECYNTTNIRWSASSQNEFVRRLQRRQTLQPVLSLMTPPKTVFLNGSAAASKSFRF